PTTTAAVASGAPGSNGWYTSDVTVRLTASDNLSGIKNTFYKIDGGGQQTYGGSPFSVSGDLVHTITFWSVDKAGKTESTESLTTKVDTPAPTVAISAPSASITAGGPVSYTITYTDANFQASNLSTADVHLVSTGNATGTLSFDNKTGASRTVSISNITGDGT